jgi:hypothetical protein
LTGRLDALGAHRNPAHTSALIHVEIGARRYDVPGTFNGYSGTYELVIDPNSNFVYHFNFVR